LTIDDKFQYGQKNAQGDMRFVVYHEKSRKPFQVHLSVGNDAEPPLTVAQHRFIETSIASLAANVSAKIAGVFGYGTVADVAKTLANNYVGDYLHTF